MIFPDLWFDQEDDVFKDYRVIDENGKEGNCLPQLSRVNIFIGPNNSGKSRFHRNIFLSLNQKRKMENQDSRAFDLIDFPFIPSEYLVKGIDSYYRHLRGSSNRKKHSILSKLENLKLDDFESRISFQEKFLTLKNINEEAKKMSWDGYAPGHIKDENFGVWEFGKLFTQYITPAVNQTLGHINEWKYHTSFIPALRTLRNFAEFPIQSKFWADHFYGSLRDTLKQSVLFSGESLYDDIQSNLLGLIHQIEAHIEFSRFIGNTFYDGQKVSITAPNNKDHGQTNIMVKIGDAKELPITQLGDGVQAIIGLTYQLYTRPDQAHFLFIDEPEQNLHPGFQRIFMETLLQDRFKDTQVFICTHSNHFLDMSLDYPDDISIYSFQKKKEKGAEESHFEIKHRAGRDKEVLQMIGARNSSVFLSNCTIWVEVITDRLYLRTWLEIYQEMIRIENSENKKYHEDIHYSFVEFGGANITHWSFLDQEEGIGVEALCGPVLVIADRDDISKADSAKARRHIKLKESLGNDYAMIERREVENILLPTQITQAAGKVFGNDEIKDAQLIFSAYEKAYLGSFLDKQVGVKKAEESIFASKSGTIKNKVKFCRAVVDDLKIEMGKAEKKEELKALLLPDGKTEDDNKLDTPYRLAKRAYEFIKEHN